MLLTALRDEFIFHCECRKLSPKTIKNYGKQIDYLLNFLETEKSVRHIEDVEQKQSGAVLSEAEPKRIAKGAAGRRQRLDKRPVLRYNILNIYPHEAGCGAPKRLRLPGSLLIALL